MPTVNMAPFKRRIITSVADAGEISFDRFTAADIPRVARLAALSGSRGCDLTVGGIFLWQSYFRYRRAFVGDTMLLRGVNEDDVSMQAFSLPLGIMPLEQSVSLLRDYCDLTGSHLRFSAVPEERVDELRALGATSVTELTDWADYVYDATELASLTGKRFNKKRNHVNRFRADNPGFELCEMTPDMAPSLLDFMNRLPVDGSKPLMADYERRQVIDLLRDLPDFLQVMEGGVLTTPTDGIVAFTIGEIVGDTLHLHVEKMRHDIAGAGEAINMLFAALSTSRHPQIRYINRQDDAGDPGLRRAKESYHPLYRLRKYNVIF